jgi:UDP-N-acetylglucosamine 2-epimerase (non-hydrolysing)
MSQAFFHDIGIPEPDFHIEAGGGLQEETTVLGVPCITLRENTERPITLRLGSNILAGTAREDILTSYRAALGRKGKSKVPPKWDGRASKRIWEVICNSFPNCRH